MGQASGTSLSIDSYSEAVLDDNPIGYWRLGETSGSTAIDSSGNGLHGTYHGGVGLGEPGASQTNADFAVSFDGSNAYVDGELAGTIGGSRTAGPSSQTFLIGRAPARNTGGTYNQFAGGLDEVAIYGRSLDAGEIREHYLSAVPEPSTLMLLTVDADAAGPGDRGLGMARPAAGDTDSRESVEQGKPHRAQPVGVAS